MHIFSLRCLSRNDQVGLKVVRCRPSSFDYIKSSSWFFWLHFLAVLIHLMNCCYINILKITLSFDLIYLFLERGEGKEKERERNFDVREKR